MINDPLRLSNSESARVLFDAFTRIADDTSTDSVIEAATNLIINALRQSCSSRRLAEEKFDELFGKAKTLLLDQHYDGVTGKRRSVFPFDQTIEIPFIDFDNRN